MLQMCNKRQRQSSTHPAIQDRNYNRLGNLMFILSFGAVHGQVRHIDHMNPNLQICLYMSQRCPSTIVYAMKDPAIQNCRDLWQHWESICNTNPLPPVIHTIFETMADTPLKTKPYAKYFAHWQTLNAHLANFGRLYQPVSHSLQIHECDPGTTLIAGGANHVHAGPPATGPRMFAFAIGIPEDSINSKPVDFNIEQNIVGRDHDSDENDGEIQYSPALLHIDLCCILFGMLDFEIHLVEQTAQDPLSIHDAKEFLLQLLLPYLHEYPNETYSIHFGEERQMVREWLEELVEAQREDNAYRIKTLVETAARSDVLMFSPDVATKAFRKQQQRQQRRSVRHAKKVPKKEVRV